MSNIICPKCNAEFAISESVNKELAQLKETEKAKLETEKKVLRKQMEDFLKNKEDEFANKTADFEKQKIQIEQQAKQKTTEEYSVKLKALEEERNAKNEQLQTLQKKELDLLRQKDELEQQQKNMEMELEKRFLEKRKDLEKDVLKREQELFDLKMKEKETQSELRMREKDTQMESLKKTIEELKRKSEQGSMQAQGEAQELMLEDMLRENFKLDSLSEVGKGVEGADCIQTVHNKYGQPCGTIIFESKNAKHWKNEWIDKLKNDMRNKNADIAILVTQVFPKNVTQFTQIEGVWVCNFSEVIAIVTLLRQGLAQVYEVQKSQENKGDKMELLYKYLTGTEFRGQIEAIIEGFSAIKDGIMKERMQMEKIWKEREKQVEKVLLSTSGLYGSVKGIAGSSIGNIPLLDGGKE